MHLTRESLQYLDFRYVREKEGGRWRNGYIMSTNIYTNLLCSSVRDDFTKHINFFTNIIL